ncbi:glucose 1-dehydrogenase [Candidatus Poriferisocius sp.]|uniref:glucose 1-dehydrogenase n=1 Tax=Candidatus Poriferisocius sp. TaxID=3101276 RepID=UPI003B0241CD
MGRLDGKVAIISGGARGQGEAEVRLFTAEGAKVVFGDVLHDQGEAVAADVGPDAHYLPLDVTDPKAWQAAVAETTRRYGPPNVLVNNAGVLLFGVSMVDTTLEDYMRVININQVGVFLGMKYTVPAMIEGGAGSIVNISSTNGITGYGGTVAYTASKFAVRGMTKNAALELGKHGIRVNSIHPGGVETPMTAPETLGDAITDEARDQVYAMLPLGRAAQPVEIARLAAYLASDDSSYSTGSEFIADGGMLSGVVNPEV